MNSLGIGVAAALLATVLGTVAALGQLREWDYAPRYRARGKPIHLVG